jgi:polysaccharide chain length determinant protein (PEP-CTERM system associated)
MEPGDYLEILKRRKWYVVFSVLTVLFGASVYSVVAPEKYKSSTTILVVPQKVPEGYVRSTIATRVDERLFTLRQQVMSRTRLTAVMEEIGIFKEERKKQPIEEVVEKMRKSIDIQIASATTSRRQQSSDDAFTLTFVHDNPQMAMLAASRLASFFIDENLKSREQQAVGTSEFLESQLTRTKVRLEAQEEKVKRYKMRFMGELPQQMQANLQILSRLQDQARINSEMTRTAQDRKVFVETQLSAMVAQMSAAERAARDNGTDLPLLTGDPAGSLVTELAAKRSQLAALSAKYTEQYPEIRRLKVEIPRLEKRIEEVRSGETEDGSAPGGAPRPATSPRTASGPLSGSRERDEIIRLRAQTVALDSEIASLKKDREGIRRSIAELEARVEMAPRREQEMVALSRDYENLKLSYDDLLKKKLDAEVSQNLEKRQKGEQFQILDPADLPQEPFTPNRPRVFGIAFAAALLLGFGGAFGLELLDPTLRKKRDFLQFFQVPVLASIPTFRDEVFEARENRRKIFVYSGLISFTVAVSVFLLTFGSKVRNLLVRIF